MYEVTGNFIIQDLTQYYAQVEVQTYDIRKGSVSPENFTMYIMVKSDAIDQAEVEAKNILRQLGYESTSISNCFIRTVPVNASDMYQKGED